MGFLVTASCGLVGSYLLLRRLALVGDAISHSILPGLVVAFLLFQTSATWAMFLGALGAGLLTVFLIELIHRQSRIKTDAAICITFTVLFALGVALLSMLEGKGNFHLDAECVLYGEIAFVALEPPVEWGAWILGPPSVLRMAVVFVLLVLVVLIFYKELLITSFDPGLAQSMGINPALWHYGLMTALAIVIMAAFEAVGAILAVAMLIVPPMFAAQLSFSQPARLGLIVLHAALSSLVGFHLAVWLECSVAGGMVVAGAAWFVVAWGMTALVAAGRRWLHPPPSPSGPSDSCKPEFSEEFLRG